MPNVDQTNESPAMRQYRRFKRQHADCLLLFHLDGGYQLFDADAMTAEGVAGLPMSNVDGVARVTVPEDKLEVYLRRFINAGHRCAVCEKVSRS